MSENKSPLVSVIVPVYNAEKYLHKCIDSILSQTMPDFELLLVDDGSKDSSGNICDDYAEKDARVRVFHKANGGVSSARNAGLDNAEGKWVTFCDADDYWINTQCLSKLTNGIEKTGCDCIRGEYQGVNNYGNVTLAPRLKKDLADRILSPYEMIKKGIDGEFFGVLFLYRKPITNGIRYNEKMAFLEDMDFISRIMMKVKKCVYMPECFYAYRKHSDSASNSTKISNVLNAFDMSDRFDEYAIQAKDTELKHYYTHYSIMMYIWTLSTLATDPYYKTHNEIIQSANLGRLWRRCIYRCLNNCLYIFNIRYLQLLFPPKTNLILIRIKAFWNKRKLCNTQQS